MQKNVLRMICESCVLPQEKSERISSWYIIFFSHRSMLPHPKENFLWRNAVCRTELCANHMTLLDIFLYSSINYVDYKCGMFKKCPAKFTCTWCKWNWLLYIFALVRIRLKKMNFTSSRILKLFIFAYAGPIIADKCVILD